MGPLCACRVAGVCLLVSLGVVLLAACGGGGGGGDADEDSKDLVLVKFSLIDVADNPTGASGTTNAYRNNRLRFTFSEEVDASSVSDRTIQIGIPSGTSLFLTAKGRFETDGNVVIFDPRVTVIGEPHPFGFEADSVYSVTVKGLPETKTIQSPGGDQVMSTFTTSFTTTDLYLPDHDQPEITVISPPALDANQVAHLLGQTPEERNIENDASRDLDGLGQPIIGTGVWEQVWVPSSGDVVLEFSEAVNPATFDPDMSFMVTNTDRGREVLGVFRYSDDAKTVTFRPTFGFGRGPYVIRVDVTVDLTDLAGNPIANPQQWFFLSEYDPTAVNEGVMEEYFDDNLYEDTNFTPPGAEGIADWNPVTAPGTLASTFGNTSTTVPTPSAPFGSGNCIPMGGGGTWDSYWGQLWYSSAAVGSAGTISGYKYFMYSNSSSSGLVYKGLTVTIGHAKGTSCPFATNNLRASHFTGTPVTAINNHPSWTLPSIPTGTPIPFPKFTGSFGYNGTSNLIVDICKDSASFNTYWSVASGNQNGARAYGTPKTGTTTMGTGVPYMMQCVIDFRTEDSMAQSMWFKMDSQDPIFLDPIINPTEQPAGTETAVMFEGAVGDGNGQVDPTSATGYVDDVEDLDGHEYLRFRAAFTANLGTGVGPKLEDIVIPYIFF
jgi:Big-like domain-containing protein